MDPSITPTRYNPSWTRPAHIPPYTSAYSKSLQPHPSYYEPSHHSPVPPGSSTTQNSKWMIPLCYEPKNDVETCCLGCWCPAILYGHTQYRLRQLEKNKDPLDMSEFKVIDGPCAVFFILRYFTNCDWVFIMAQHSRIRDRYNIDGTVCGDYLSSYYCPPCTLMQADREIRARESKSAKMEKFSGTVILQPKTEPKMRYPAPSLFEDGTVQGRDGLVRQEITATATATKECQTPGRNGQNVGKLYKFNHSKRHAELNKLQEDPKAEGGDGKKGRKFATANSRELQLSNDEAVNRTQSTNHAQEGLDAVSSPRHTSRHQNNLKKQDRFPGHSLSACIGDGTGSSENQDPITNRRPMLEHSEDVSISQVRGKRVLKQLARAEGHSGRTTVGNTSESLADEPVLVFYDDGDRPQQHLLADCARFRSSTIGRTDTPHEHEQQAGWRVEKIVGGDGLSEKSNSHTLDACQEVSVIEKPVRVISEHSMGDCAIQDINGAEDTKQIQGLLQHFENYPSHSILAVSNIPAHQDLTHSLEDCKSPVSVTTPDLTEPNISNPEPTQQHSLDSCSVEPAVLADPMPVEGYFQHSLTDCAASSREYASASPTEFTSSIGLPTPEPLSPNQHHLVNCASGIEAPRSVDSGDVESGRKMRTFHSRNQSTPNLGNSQNEQPTFTTSEALEEAMRDQHDPIRNRNPKIVIISPEAQVSMETLPGASSSIRNHDGAADNQEGSQQLTDAVAAMQNVLHAAAEKQRVMVSADFEDSDTTGIDANAKAKKPSTRSRSKTVGGKVQKEKSKV